MVAERLVKIFTLSWQAFGKFRKQIVFLTALAFVEAFLEGIGINALIPLFSLVFGQGNKGTDFISRQIGKLFGFFHLELSITYLLVFIGLLFAAKAVVGIWINLLRAKITNEYEEQIKNNLFKKVLHADWPYLMQQKSGYLETILLQDVLVFSGMLNQFALLLGLLIGLAVYAVVAMNISASITLIAFGLGLVSLLVFKRLYWQVRQIAQERTNLSKDAVHHISENIIGIKTIKVMGVEEGAYEKSSRYFKKLKEMNIRTVFLKGLSGALIVPVGVIFILSVFAFLYRSPNFQLAALAVIVYLIDRIFNYVQQLQRGLHTANDSLPHVVSILEYEKRAAQNKEMHTGIKPFDFQKSLEFKGMTFAYKEGKEILTKLNLVIQKGTTIGIIGPSGVGKTTLVDLILRLLSPTQGSILLDGVDISEISLSEWRKNIGYVSQDIFLTNDTIENNIRFYNQNLTQAEIEEAAKMANIYDFIETCPKKFETIVGERGIALSAGQRQRIVIARVLARKPQFLILDEATSALDNESEMMIQQVIKKLKGKITVLIIAHRLSTIMDVDELLILNQGRVEEQGSPQVLLADKNSYFFKVYNLREV